MYTYILYEWCVFNWYPDVTLMWSIVTTHMYINCPFVWIQLDVLKTTLRTCISAV